MVDFNFKRSIFNIREMAFTSYGDFEHRKCDVIYLHSSNGDVNQAPSNSYAKVQYTLVNDLLLSEDELLGKVKKNCKYEIKRAEKEGVITNIYTKKAEYDADNIVFKFKQVYNKMFKSKGLKNTFNEPLVLEAICSKQLIVTTNALKVNPECVVYHAYLVDGESAVLMYSASPLWDDGDKDKANKIGRLNKNLHWQDMLWFKEKGYVRYEWGGISGLGNPSGIDRFKSEFGGDIRCYTNCLIPCSLLGRLYVNLVKRREK